MLVKFQIDPLLLCRDNFHDNTVYPTSNVIVHHVMLVVNNIR